MILFCSRVFIFKCTWLKFKQLKLHTLKYKPLASYSYSSQSQPLGQFLLYSSRNTPYKYKKKIISFMSQKMIVAVHTVQRFANSCLVFHWINACITPYLTQRVSSLPGHYSYLERFKCPDRALSSWFNWSGLGPICLSFWNPPQIIFMYNQSY